MKKKFESLLKNHTWNIINKTSNDKKSLNDKWIYKFKRNVDDVIIKYKIKWCVKNFLQQYDIDFDQIFVFVIKSMTFRILFAIVAFLNLKIKQMNVKIVFLYKFIDFDIYVKYFIELKNDNVIYKFNKILYDLKQFSRLWYECLLNFFFWKIIFQLFWCQSQYFHYFCKFQKFHNNYMNKWHQNNCF